MHNWVSEDEIDWFEFQRVGKRGLTPTRTVTDHDVLAFAGLTGDMAELHTSDSYAAKTEFGGRIAHGMYNLALAHGLIVRAGHLVTAGIALLGWNNIKFSAPLRIGDTVQAEWETIVVRESASHPQAGIVVDRVTLRKEDGTIVLTGEVAELVRKRPA